MGIFGKPVYNAYGQLKEKSKSHKCLDLVHISLIFIENTRDMLQSFHLVNHK